MGRAFVKEVFPSRETMGMGDVGIERSDINSCHDGAERKRHGERLNDLKEVVCVFYVAEARSVEEEKEATVGQPGLSGL